MDAQLLDRLGSEWRPSTSLGAITHAPTGIDFVPVAGGRLEMGFTPADRRQVARYVDWSAPLTKAIEEIAASASPVRTVEIAPFLCSRRLVDPRDIAQRRRAVGEGAVSRADAVALASDLGFRLPSEAELEWLARDGKNASFVLDAGRLFAMAGRDERRVETRWGALELNRQTWAADDWHADYEGAPTDGSPWLEGDACGVFRGGFWVATMQSAEELLSALAAKRHRGGTAAGVRLVHELR